MRRKVKVATTKRRRTLHGSVTNHYRYQDKQQVARRDGPSVFGQVMRWQAEVSGLYPFRPLRFALVIAVLALLNGSWVALPAFAAAAAIWWWQRPVPPAIEAPARPVVLPGSEWCDHCADWTTHSNAGHYRTTRIAA